MHLTRHAAAFAVLGLLAPVGRAAAQQPSAVLRGVVYDSLSGAPLAGALVQVAPAGDVSHVRTAIAREKQIKAWSRSKRVALVEATNAGWLDLMPAARRPSLGR